jgi:hypothetical protein
MAGSCKHGNEPSISIKYEKFLTSWAHGGLVVKALHYKLAGHGFDSQWCH